VISACERNVNTLSWPVPAGSRAPGHWTRRTARQQARGSAVRALPVWIGSLGLLLGEIAIPLRALGSLASFAQVSPSRVTTLCPALLATTHRR
jgi:hypothetical protein